MHAPRVHVGQAALHGALERYAARFDFLEIRAAPNYPAAARLRRMRADVPSNFSFSVVAPAALCALASNELDAELVAQTRKAAELLEARFVLLRTPATLGPSARGHARLGKLIEAVKGAARETAWEPRGVWTDEDSERTATEHDALLVRDLAEFEAPPGAVVYSRLLALGRNARIGAGAVERVLERLEGVDEAFVIVEGQGALGLARRVKSMNGAGGGDDRDDALGGDASDSDDESDDDLDHDDLDDEDE